MQSWVNQYYPGTKTAITEYNFGALDSLNGALAEADALGIFGALQGSTWPTCGARPRRLSPGRSPSGCTATTTAPATASAPPRSGASSANRVELAVYAATNAAGALTVMVINKTGSDLTSALTLKNFTPAAQVRSNLPGPPVGHLLTDDPLARTITRTTPPTRSPYWSSRT